MTHPNVEVLHWSSAMRLEEKQMLDKSGDFAHYVLRQGYHALADKMTKEGAVTWTTEEREYGAPGPTYLREGTARTVGAIGLVRDRDEVARYAVQLFQMREAALTEALKMVEGLVSGFCGDADKDYRAARGLHRRLEELRDKAVEPGMWRPMWTERFSYGTDTEWLYADGTVRDRPYWRASRVMPLEASFEESDAPQTGPIDEQFPVAWRPQSRVARRW